MRSRVRDEFFGDLQKHVRGDLRTDAYSKVLYSTDASIYQVAPYGVLIPESVEDIHAAVELAARYEIAVLPRTAGSSLAGQAVNEALVIDMSRHLDRVLEVNQDEQWVRVQPGVVLDELNAELAPFDLQYGPDPASSNRACMGGIIANNSTGSHSILYGMTADHILEAKVILSDGSTADFGPVEANQLSERCSRAGLEGDLYRKISDLVQVNSEVIRAGTPRHWRRCGGYNLDRFVNGTTYNYPQDSRFNLAKLVCGSEGTLAVMTEAKLNLVPLPRQTALAVVHFDSLFKALSAVSTILETGPSAVELLDNLGLRLCRDVPTYARLLKTFVEGTPNCVLITEFHGETEAELQDRIRELDDHMRSRGAGHSIIVPAVTPDKQANVWTVRKVGLGLMMSIKGDHKPIPFIEDAAVPVEYLAEYVTKIEKYCNDLGSEVAYYAHASAGCVHIRPLIDTKQAGEIAKLPDIVAFSVDLLKGYGGSLSSEHGAGRVRSWMNEKFFGSDLYRVYQEVKYAFDPKNIFNPGNIVDAPAMTEDLRYGSSYEVLPVKEHLDFSNDMGFHRAVEMCNGAGICRKKTSGTMCPSFMVTREEEHSTRGRANALRAAMSGNLPAEELTSKRMYEVMDLCVECKACKAECPSSVDMAKIKFEFLAHYNREHGVSRRARMFAGIGGLSRLGSGSTAPIANFLLRIGLIRGAMERLFGISRKRTLPLFSREPFMAWYQKRSANGRARRGTAVDPDVVLFVDTLNNYSTPDIAKAALQVFEAAGLSVAVPGVLEDGRPMISKGLVEEARDAARRVVETLSPYAEKGIPVVGLEPSSLLTLRDEYLYLLPDDPRVRILAGQALLFDEYVSRLASEERLNLAFTDDARLIFLHGHCHQKALVGTGVSKEILTLPPNYTVHEIDSGCCGMAGSFGYEAEHYEISMKMAERRLLPAVREMPVGAIVSAAGVSCRQQIEHGAKKRALHPAQVLRDALQVTATV